MWRNYIKPILTWSAISIGLVVGFWLAYRYGFVGNWGPVRYLRITEWWAVNFDKPLSGLIWDLPFAPVWPTAFVLALKSPRIKTDSTWITAVLVFIPFGMIIGRLVGFSAPLVFGFALGVLIVVDILEWQNGVAIALGFGLGVGIVTSLPFGAGAAVALILGLYIGHHLGGKLRWLIRKFLRLDCWQKIGTTGIWRAVSPWLIGK